jgi:hypothetical protein
MEDQETPNTQQSATDQRFPSSNPEIQPKPANNHATEEIQKRLTELGGIVWGWIKADAKKVREKNIVRLIEIGLLILVIRVYGGQLDVMSGQLGQMEESSGQTAQLISAAKSQSDAMVQSLALQRELAGGSRLAVAYITVYHLGSKIRIEIAAQNNGTKLNAEGISAAALMDIHKPLDRRVTTGFQAPLNPSRPLQPFTMQPKLKEPALFKELITKTITAEEYDSYHSKGARIYIWGVFKHKEVGIPSDDGFCKYVSADIAFSADSGLDTVIGSRIGHPFEYPPDCDDK